MIPPLGFKVRGPELNGNWLTRGNLVCWLESNGAEAHRRFSVVGVLAAPRLHSCHGTLVCLQGVRWSISPVSDTSVRPCTAAARQQCSPWACAGAILVMPYCIPSQRLRLCFIHFPTTPQAFHTSSLASVYQHAQTHSTWESRMSNLSLSLSLSSPLPLSVFVALSFSPKHTPAYSGTCIFTPSRAG